MSKDNEHSYNEKNLRIAGHLLEVMYAMLTKHVEFVDNMDSPTKRKIAAMSVRHRNPHRVREMEESIRILRENSLRWLPEGHFS